MGVTNNSLPEIVKVQPNSASKSQNSKGLNAPAEDNIFRRLIEERQAMTKNEGGSDQKTNSMIDTSSQNEASSESSLVPDDTDVNKQILIAAMLSNHIPTITQLDMQPNAETDVDAVNVEGVNVLMQLNTSNNEAQQLTQDAQLEAEGLLDGNEVLTESTEKQSTAKTEQPVVSKESAAEITKAKTEVAAKPFEKDIQKDTVTVEQNPNAETPLFRTVDTLPIRVGDAVVAEEKTEMDVSEQLTKQLSGAIREKVSSIKLELNPKSLGRIHVEMEWLQDGSLHLSMKAEKIGAQALLESSAMVLQRILEQDVQNPVQVDVQQYQEEELPNHDHNGQQQQERQQNNQHGQDKEQDAGNRFLQELRLGLAPINA